LGYDSFGFGSGRVSDHLISSNLGFRVISGQAGPGRVLFCDVLFWVGSNFGSGWISGRQTLIFFYKFILDIVRSRLLIML
jgi:hypothetical protein